MPPGFARTEVLQGTGGKVHATKTLMRSLFAKSSLPYSAWAGVPVLLATASVLACGGEVTSPVSDHAAITQAPTSTPQEPPTAAPDPTPVATSSTPTPAPSPIPSSSPTSQPTVNPGVASGATSTYELVIAVASIPAGIPTYDRDDWRHWTDEDGDCQNARHEVLIEESRVDVTYRAKRECQVVTGEWFGAFTGTTVTEAGELDIDHLVPLKNAHQSGGWAWSPERKEQYANSLADPAHLIAVTSSANRSKGARGPDEWRPPDESFWCDYAVAWITVKQNWDLTATTPEAEALEEMLGMCASPPGLTVIMSEPASVTMSPTPTRTPDSTPTLAGDAKYESCDEAEEAGEQRVRGSSGPGRGFPQAMVPSARDGDGDGIVCES